jgi:hypothetical protein
MSVVDSAIAAIGTVTQRSACKIDFFLLGSGTSGATVFGSMQICWEGKIRGSATTNQVWLELGHIPVLWGLLHSGMLTRL